MNIFSKILIILVILEFLFIMYLETFATNSKQTAKVFKMDINDLNTKSLNTALKNQGIYNGLLAILLIYGLFFSPNPVEITRLLLLYIMGVALYGSFSVDKSIFFKQAGLAALAFIISFF